MMKLAETLPQPEPEQPEQTQQPLRYDEQPQQEPPSTSVEFNICSPSTP